jgi:acetyl-CoA carboxylase biotin carboxyl carrier protein
MPRKQPKPVSSVRSTDSGTSLDVEALRQIIEILEASEVTRLVWTNGSERVSIRRGAPEPPVVHHVTHSSAPTVVPVAQSVAPSHPAQAEVRGGPSGSARAPVAEAADKKGHVITSPFVGTFYRSSAPDQPSFTEVGNVVKKGQVLCIVEAMKLMNEIESEFSGKVLEVLAQNAQPVEFGQPLFRIEPS